MSKAWKDAEREVAAFFGGQRRIRVRYDEEIGDIIHPTYSIEVKYGGQIPAYLKVTAPTILKVESGHPKGEKVHNRVEIGKQKVESGQLLLEHFAVPSQCLVEGTLRLRGYVAFERKEVSRSEFLSKAMAQATRYDPELIPIVCVKPKRWRGFIVIF